MTEKQAQKIFEKYNPAGLVTRCKNGRATVRKLLDSYAIAAANLYGVISLEEFVEIFNSQNEEKTDTDEVFELLLPFVIKSKWYCFYKNYIVHYWAIEDFDYVEHWIIEQGDKPRFVPKKEEFLKFENQYYESPTQQKCWHKLLDFIVKEWPDNRLRYNFLKELKEISEFVSGMNEIRQLTDRYRIEFRGEKQLQEFFELYMEARNNNKLWSNKGYSPNELFKVLDSQKQKKDLPEFVLQERYKVGMNDPCPCGSGKKYKKCCRLTEEMKTAQLTASECLFFYKTFYGLMGFINEKKRIIKQDILPIYPNPVGDDQIYKVREVLWQNPELIDDYIASAKLPEDQEMLLKSWRDNHKKGMFFLMEYKPEYALAIGTDKKKQDRIFAIKGISRSLSDALQQELPLQFESVLLPFNDKIIYDGFISRFPIKYLDGAKKAFKEMYQSALVRGIVTKL